MSFNLKINGAQLQQCLMIMRMIIEDDWECITDIIIMTYENPFSA